MKSEVFLNRVKYKYYKDIPSHCLELLFINKSVEFQIERNDLIRIKNDSGNDAKYRFDIV
jgi:hypothetical protein